MRTRISRICNAISEVFLAALVWSAALSLYFVFFFPVRVSLFLWVVLFGFLLIVLALRRLIFHEGPD